MTPNRWQQIEALYNAARERGPAALEGAPDDLRREVESLLAQQSTASNILTQAANNQSMDDPTQTAIAPGQVAPASVTPGMTLSPYRIDAPIGQGGMGQVFRATDTRLNRSVAIKTCFTRFSDRFQREALAIAALNHPNVATLHDVGSDPSGLAYLVLEFVEGPNLADLIHKGPLESENTRRIDLARTKP